MTSRLLLLLASAGLCLLPAGTDADQVLFNTKSSVHGLAIDETGQRLAVAAENTLILFEVVHKGDAGVSAVELRELDRHALNGPEYALGDENPLLELKIRGDNTVLELLLCSRKRCILCERGLQHCRDIVDELRPPLASAKGALVGGDKTIVRSVGETRASGAITGGVEWKKSANDSSANSELSVRFSFSNGGYSYFVGSATRSNKYRRVPPEGGNHTDIRLTRVCSNDVTPSFDSRMDLNLTCEGLDGRTPYALKAATLSGDEKRLMLVVENGTTANETDHIVCEYEMQRLDTIFDATRDECLSNFVDSAYIKRKCGVLIAEYCFLWSWKTDAICTTYRREGFNSDGIWDPCKPNGPFPAVTNTSATFGWLENFNGVTGSLVAKLPAQIRNVSGIFDGIDEGTLYVIDDEVNEQSLKESRVRRLTKAVNGSRLLWTQRVGQRSPMAMVIDRKTRALYWANTSEIHYAHDSCSGLYPECETLFFNDPLQCGWCAEVNGTGATIALRDEGACTGSGQRLTQGCPPVITQVVVHTDKSWNSSNVTIDGLHLSPFRMEGLNISACNQSCDIKANSDRS